MHVIFSLFLSLSLLMPPNPPVQVCNVNIKKSTFSLECCRQSVSGRVQSLQGVRALQAGRQTKLYFFRLTIKNCLCIYWKSKFGGLFIHMFVAAQVYTHTQTHTLLLHSKYKHLVHLIPLLFFQGEDANLAEMML